MVQSKQIVELRAAAEVIGRSRVETMISRQKDVVRVQLELFGGSLHRSVYQLVLREEMSVRDVRRSARVVETLLEIQLHLSMERGVRRILGQVEQRASVFFGRLQLTRVHIIEESGQRLRSLGIQVQLALATRCLCEARSAIAAALSHEIVTLARAACNHDLVDMIRLAVPGGVRHVDLDAPIRESLIRIITPREQRALRRWLIAAAVVADIEATSHGIKHRRHACQTCHCVVSVLHASLHTFDDGTRGTGR